MRIGQPIALPCFQCDGTLLTAVCYIQHTQLKYYAQKCAKCGLIVMTDDQADIYNAAVLLRDLYAHSSACENCGLTPTAKLVERLMLPLDPKKEICTT